MVVNLSSTRLTKSTTTCRFFKIKKNERGKQMKEILITILLVAIFCFQSTNTQKVLGVPPEGSYLLFFSFNLLFTQRISQRKQHI